MPTVVIAPDEMAADLLLAEGERLASSNAAVVLLARHGVRQGLQHGVLARLPELVGPATLRVALGEPPLAGQDGRVVYGFPLPEGDAPGGGELPSAVEPGEVLARVYPATAGRFGHTVTGRTLAAAPVGNPTPVAGDGCERAPDGQHLVARRAGVPHLLDCVVVVRPLLRFARDLGPEDAPVVAAGDVLVEGFVAHPATIEAAGDVFVTGGVQGAHIRAGGRIVVHGGVRQEARLEAGAEVCVKFIEQSSVVAAGMLTVAEDVIRGAVVAPRARIGGAAVGGELTLVAWLEAGEVGAALAVPTRVAVVPPPPPAGPRPHVRVAGALHPGVALQLGAQHLRPASPIPACTFIEGRGAVEIAPYDLDLERTFA